MLASASALFEAGLGFEPLEVEDGQAKVRVTPQGENLNNILREKYIFILEYLLFSFLD